MSNDPSNMSLEIELGQLQQLLASALERLQAVNAKSKLDASPPQEQNEEQIAQFRGDIERTCLSCASLLRELERLRHRVNGAAPNGAFGTNEISPEIWQWARAQPINEEEIVAGIREIEKTGGLELRDFIHDLERNASLTALCGYG